MAMIPRMQVKTVQKIILQKNKALDQLVSKGKGIRQWLPSLLNLKNISFPGSSI